ncbi:hypothetical protein CLAC_07290 [Corynebacterium lactis RW2-5]|uniref:Uncharacterized protein n=1 Tax=Corynebacterium lactis RW2-5 TaxID=1408189 RepID=A0A0K2H3D4_9CORY|nr:hypothetical protein CLAC_07290 [Corynebacterium lactis RW2-5]
MESALTYDLMMAGRSIHDLGTTRLSWHELAAFIKHAPPTAAIRAVADRMAPYRTTEAWLLATSIDMLAGANWQRAGGKGPRPQPILSAIERSIRSAEQDKRAPHSTAELAQIRASLRKRRAQTTSR